MDKNRKMNRSKYYNCSCCRAAHIRGDNRKKHKCFREDFSIFDLEVGQVDVQQKTSNQDGSLSSSNVDGSHLQ